MKLPVYGLPGAARLLALLASAAVAACAGPGWPSNDNGLPDVPIAQCPAAGGTVQVIGGLAPAPMCVVPTPDAGRPCSDSAECAGRCLVLDAREAGLRPGARASGSCESSNAQFGCFAEVRRGILTGTLCVD